MIKLYKLIYAYVFVSIWKSSTCNFNILMLEIASSCRSHILNKGCQHIEGRNAQSPCIHSRNCGQYDEASSAMDSVRSHIDAGDSEYTLWGPVSLTGTSERARTGGQGSRRGIAGVPSSCSVSSKRWRGQAHEEAGACSKPATEETADPVADSPAKRKQGRPKDCKTKPKDASVDGQPKRKRGLPAAVK